MNERVDYKLGSVSSPWNLFSARGNLHGLETLIPAPLVEVGSHAVFIAVTIYSELLPPDLDCASDPNTCYLVLKKHRWVAER